MREPLLERVTLSGEFFAPALYAFGHWRASIGAMTGRWTASWL
ncbi:hypothetical protein [Streptomyces sp. NPDC001833]